MALQALTSQKPALNIPPEIEQLKSQEVVKVIIPLSTKITTSS